MPLPWERQTGTGSSDHAAETAPSLTASSPDSLKGRTTRIDPEGDDDELTELATQLRQQNEERKRREVQRRAELYRRDTPPRHISTPRSQSIGNLRMHRRPLVSDDDISLPPKSLAQSKSASQSRASVRSLKRRAPQPPREPPREPSREPPNSIIPGEEVYIRVPLSQQCEVVRPADLPPPPPIYSQPYQVENPYATPHVTAVIHSNGFHDGEPVVNSDTEEMPIMRPARPFVPPKPKMNGRPYQRPPTKPPRTTSPGGSEYSHDSSLSGLLSHDS